jgi:hypothetical protein
MPDARYLRSQVELCLEIARQLGDQQAAANLRAAAARYFARAVEAERHSSSGPCELNMKTAQ